MKVNLYKVEIDLERIDIYYNSLDSNLNKIIEIASSVSPQIHLQDEESTFLVNIDDIYYFEFVDRMTFAYLEEKVYSIDKPLKELENLYTSLGFIRINKSQIVNINYIDSIQSTVGMRVIADLKNKEKLIINRNYRNSFIEELERYGGSI